MNEKYYESRLYKIYHNMKNRCYNKNVPAYKNYGGRGIKICDEWLNNWWEFYNWAINNGYNDTLTIDRINVNGNYEPNNCRWVSDEEQAYNKRNTVRVCINDEMLTLKEIAEIYNLNEHTVRTRYKKGYRGKDLIKQENLKNIPVICVTTGEIFPSIKIAQESLNIHGISECCNGKRKYCGKTEDGRKREWKYYNK